MKTVFSLILVFTLSTTLCGQDKMKHFGKKIYLDKMPITLNTAAFMAFEVSTASYTHIKKAQRLRNWNYFWAVIGGYELGAGLATAAGGGSNSQIAWLDVGIGAVCIGIIPGREERYKMHLREAVELYNDALELPEN